MSGHSRKYKIMLTNEERNHLKAILCSSKTCNTIRLLVPYVFVGLCYTPFKMLLSNFVNKPYDISTIWQIVIGVNPDGELWFLYALFVIAVITALFAFRISLLGLVAAAALLIWNPWGIITNFLFFFLLGIYMRREHKDFVLHLTARHILAAVAVFLLGLYGLLGLKEHACFLLTATSGISIRLALFCAQYWRLSFLFGSVSI